MDQDSASLLKDTNSNETISESRSYESLGERNYSEHSPQEAFSEIHKAPQHVAALFATLSALAAGMVLGWTSPILSEIEKGNFLGIIVDNNQMGWIGSFVTLGAMTMCIPTGFICDLIGRKNTLVLLIAPYATGWLLILFAKNVIMLYFGRLFAGMAVGACCVAAPLYTGEIADKYIRGTLGSYFQLMVSIGVFLAYLVGKFMSPISYTAFCACAPVVFVILFVTQPESPVFLLKKGAYEEAHLSLIKLRGSFYSVDNEIHEIESTLNESQVTVSLVHTFKKRPVQKALLIAFVLMFVQQFSGINVIILYTSEIFKSSNIKLDANTAAIIVGAFGALATLCSTILIDRMGRRFLLSLSASIMCCSSFVLALYFTLKNRTSIDQNTLANLGFIPVGAVCLTMAVFSLGLGPIPWMISSEIFLPEIKSMASSTAGTLNWLLAFIITKFYLQVVDIVGRDVTFYVFSLVCLGGALFIHFVIPETKGKSFEQIQDELSN